MYFLLSEQIEHDHYHLDWIFYAIVEEKIYQSPEGHKMKWFSLKELHEEANIFDNVRDLAIYGLEHNF